MLNLYVPNSLQKIVIIKVRMLTFMQNTCYQVSCASIFAQTNRLNQGVFTTKLLEQSKLKRELFSTTHILQRQQNGPKFPPKKSEWKPYVAKVCCNNLFLLQVVQVRLTIDFIRFLEKSMV